MWYETLHVFGEQIEKCFESRRSSYVGIQMWQSDVTGFSVSY